MAFDRPHLATWREESFLIATKLETTHALVHAAGPATEGGDDVPPGGGLGRARTAWRATVDEVNHLRLVHPSTRETDGVEAVGAALALKSSCAATMALGVLLDALGAFVGPVGADDTDVLIGASIDAEQSFGVSIAVVEAAPRSHGTSMADLERAYEAEGEVALRRRVRTALSAVGDISRRSGDAVAAPA